MTFDPEQIDLNQYVGEYTLPGANAVMVIESQQGHLHATLIQDPSFDNILNPVGMHQFGVGGDPNPWFVFQTDDKGKIKSLRFAEYTFKRRQ